MLARLSATAIELKHYRLAAASIRYAIALSPGQASYYVVLGQLYVALGYYRSARESVDTALTLDATCAPAYLLLAAIEREERNDEEAISNLNAAIAHGRSRRTAALAHRGLAVLYRDQARRDLVIASSLRSIELQRDHAPAYFFLAEAGYYGDATHGHVEFMERLTSLRGTAWEDKRDLHFALGCIYDKCGDWNKAFLHFRRGNKFRRVSYSPHADAKGTSRRISAFTRERIALLSRRGSTSDAVIFVVGMPRSGTTLVEQLLDAHSQVTGLGERADILGVALELPMRLAWTGLNYPECVEYLNADLLHDLSDAILAAFLTDAGGSPRVVTKRPDDFSELGLMHLLFPRAKIVHCRRHPADTCLSCFMQNFTEVNYSTALRDLAAHYAQYRRIMQHWYSVLPPGTIYDLDYERLVREPVESVDRLLAFCALEREPICDTFFTNRRRVDTASAWDVRQQIHTRSVGRWKNYKDDLLPLLKLLEATHAECLADQAGG